MLTTRQSLLGPRHPDVARTLIELAGIYAATHDLAQAERYARRGLSIAEAARAEPLVAGALAALANALSVGRKFAEAENLYLRSLALLEGQYGPDHPQITAVLVNLAGVRFHQKRYAEAETLLGRAVAIREAALGANDPRLVSALETYARVLRKLSRKQDAKEIESRVKAFRN